MSKTRSTVRVRWQNGLGLQGSLSNAGFDETHNLPCASKTNGLNPLRQAEFLTWGVFLIDNFIHWYYTISVRAETKA